MALSKKERVELVLLSGREGWFSFLTVAKVIKKFKETSSIINKPRILGDQVYQSKQKKLLWLRCMRPKKINPWS